MKIPSFFGRTRQTKETTDALLPPFHSHEHCIAFSSLIRERWKEMEDLTRGIAFDRNTTIYSIGDSASTIYSILMGRVKLCRLSPSGKEQTLGIYGKSDIFGEECLCGGTRREEQAFALEATDAVRFNITELLELMKSRPELLDRTLHDPLLTPA